MGLREIKDKARRRLHHAMQVGALYIENPLAPVGVPCTVRVHTKEDALGELKGTSFDYGERHEMIPKLLFLVDEVPEPVRGSVVTIIDPATLQQEAYKIDNRYPPDGITVSADVTILTPAERAGLPFPVLP